MGDMGLKNMLSTLEHANYIHNYKDGDKDKQKNDHFWFCYLVSTGGIVFPWLVIWSIAFGFVRMEATGNGVFSSAWLWIAISIPFAMFLAWRGGPAYCHERRRLYQH